MEKPIVAIVKYEEPVSSVRKAVELAKGLDKVKPNAKVFIKPNIVFWNKEHPIPKYGSITTTRVIEDMIILLKEKGVSDITIGEGTVITKPKIKGLQEHAFETLGYNVLKKKYGIKTLNIFERPFEEVDLGDNVKLKFNTDILHSDFVVDIPVLKTHGQTIVSLGIKNLKGTIDIASRKKCHNTDPVKNLDFMVSKLSIPMPPMLTIIDGIYSLELGPSYDGKARRTNLLIASTDVLSADLAGARALGFEIGRVPHLNHETKRLGRRNDLTDAQVVGINPDDVAQPYKIEYEYTKDQMPAYLARYGVTGISWPNPGSSMCTYCTGFTSPIMTNLVSIWKGKDFGDVEVLTGKSLKPTPGKKKTILLGKCMWEAHKDNPDINELYAVKGCPPSEKGIIKAFNQAGIPVAEDLFAIYDETIVPF